MNLVYSAMNETGPSAQQMAEAGGLATCQICKKVVPNGNSIAVFYGKHYVAEFALVAARHLSNHGYKVYAYSDALGQVSRDLEWHRMALKEAGGILLESLSDLPEVDLCIDALLSSHYRSLNEILNVAQRRRAMAALKWMRQSSAVLLSLQLPSGPSDADSLSIIPSHVIAFGAPLNSLHAMRANIDSIFLADIGLPKKLFRRLFDCNEDGGYCGGYDGLIWQNCTANFTMLH